MVEWALENKAQIGTSNSKLGLCGDSSGGTLSAILAHDFKEQIDYEILIYPSVNFGGLYQSYKEFSKECYILVPEVLNYFVKNLGENPTQFASQLSPIKYENFSKLSKCLIIAVELDPLIDDSKHYYQKLKQENIECILKIINGVVHGYFSSPLVFKNAFAETSNYIHDFFTKI